MKLVMNLNMCAMITQKLCTTKNLFLSTLIRDVLSHSYACWVVSFYASQVLPVCASPHHLAYHRSECSYENSNDHLVLSYYHQFVDSYGKRKTDGKDCPLRRGGGGVGLGLTWIFLGSQEFDYGLGLSVVHNPPLYLPHPNPDVYFRKFQGGF